MSDLRERVAKAMCDAVNADGTWEETGTLHREKVWLTAADAAIAISRADALEEAARVVTRHYETLCAEHRLLLVNRAAAIRALIPNGKDQ